VPIISYEQACAEAGLTVEQCDQQLARDEARLADAKRYCPELLSQASREDIGECVTYSALQCREAVFACASEVAERARWRRKSESEELNHHISLGISLFIIAALIFFAWRATKKREI